MKKAWYFFLALLCCMFLFFATGISSAQMAEPSSQVTVSPPVAPIEVTIDPRSIASEPGQKVGPTVPEGEPLPQVPPVKRPPRPDPVIQIQPPGKGAKGPESMLFEVGEGIEALSDPLINIRGINSRANPPDTVGDVGRNHYVQMVNATDFQVWDKNGNSLLGPADFGALWPAGHPCIDNLGDPIVVYDHLADRWLLSQFYSTGWIGNDPAPPFGMCIAISQTADPSANSWYLYSYDFGNNFPDYPKFGVWPDGYYMSTHEGGNKGIFVWDRASMLVGAAASYMKTTISSLTPQAGVRNTRILPADLDGPAPPNGTPNYFVRTVENRQDTSDPNDRIEIWAASVNWPALTFSFTKIGDLRQADGLAPFEIMVCDRNGQGARDCIPQPGDVDTIDALSNRPMMQLKFRKLGSEWAMVFNQTVNVAGSLQSALGFTPAGEVAGVRWYELRNSGSGWTIHQQGTYAPQLIGAATEDELLHRWMGSAAMDKDGNIAVGYNVVNSDAAAPVFPGLRYAGRLAWDALDLMTQPEKSIREGTRNQGNGDGTVDPQRWGDYSALSVDPVDDCTFWFTGHLSWEEAASRTQIASFRFDTCSTDLAISKTVSPTDPNAGEEIVYRITVTNVGAIRAQNVVVTDDLPTQVSYLANTDTCAGVAVGATGTLTCPIGDLGPDESRSFQVKVLIDPDLGGATSITNTASVTSDADESDPADNTISLTHLVNELADVRVTKVCKPDSEPTPAGTSGVCTILVTNDGPSAARLVDLVDTHLSNGAFSLATPTTSAGGPCIVGADEVSCPLGTILPGTTVRVDVPVSSNENVDVNDVALVTSATPDPSDANNEASAGLSFDASADLSITKTGPASAVAGTQFVYTLTVDNAGPSTATAVVVSDDLPAGVDFVSAVASVGTFTAGAGTITWNLGNAAPGDPVRTLDITVFVHPDEMAQLVNNASVSSITSDPDGANNLATWTVAVTAEAGLTLNKTDSPDPAVAGDDLTYTLTVGNGGPSTAQDVVVIDTLPAGTALVSAVSGTGSTACAEIVPGTVSCEVGDLDPGESETIFITVKVSPSVPDGTVLHDEAAATSPTDPDGAQAAADTEVIASAELWMEKTGTPTAGNPSGALVYRLTVHNHPGSAPDDTPTSGLGGPSDAQNVVVTDPLPLTNKKMVVQFLTPGCSYSEGSHTVTCTAPTVPAGTSVTFEIQAKIKGSVGTITNAATVMSATYDPVSGNNTDTVNNVVKGSTGKGKKR